MMKFIGIVVQEVLLFLFWFVIVTNFIPMADTDFYALVVIFLYLPPGLLKAIEQQTGITF